MSEKSADVMDGSERIFHLVPTFKKRRQKGKTRCSLFKYFTSFRFRMFRKQRIITSDFKCAVYQQFYFLGIVNLLIKNSRGTSGN